MALGFELDFAIARWVFYHLSHVSRQTSDQFCVSSKLSFQKITQDLVRAFHIFLTLMVCSSLSLAHFNWTSSHQDRNDSILSHLLKMTSGKICFFPPALLMPSVRGHLFMEMGNSRALWELDIWSGPMIVRDLAGCQKSPQRAGHSGSNL
jgi:hypothetical protein